MFKIETITREVTEQLVRFDLPVYLAERSKITETVIWLHAVLPDRTITVCIHGGMMSIRDTEGSEDMRRRMESNPYQFEEIHEDQFFEAMTSVFLKIAAFTGNDASCVTATIKQVTNGYYPENFHLRIFNEPELIDKPSAKISVHAAR